MKDRRDLEILGVAGHSLGLAVNALGIPYNLRRGSKLYLTFHVAAILFHGYAVYSHWRDANTNQREG